MSIIETSASVKGNVNFSEYRLPNQHAVEKTTMADGSKAVALHPSITNAIPQKWVDQATKDAAGNMSRYTSLLRNWTNTSAAILFKKNFQTEKLLMVSPGIYTLENGITQWWPDGCQEMPLANAQIHSFSDRYSEQINGAIQVDYADIEEIARFIRYTIGTSSNLAIHPTTPQIKDALMLLNPKTQAMKEKLLNAVTRSKIISEYQLPVLAGMLRNLFIPEDINEGIIIVRGTRVDNAGRKYYDFLKKSEAATGTASQTTNNVLQAPATWQQFCLQLHNIANARLTKTGQEIFGVSDEDNILEPLGLKLYRLNPVILDIYLQKLLQGDKRLHMAQTASLNREKLNTAAYDISLVIENGMTAVTIGGQIAAYITGRIIGGTLRIVGTGLVGAWHGLTGGAPDQPQLPGGESRTVYLPQKAVSHGGALLPPQDKNQN